MSVHNCADNAGYYCNGCDKTFQIRTGLTEHIVNIHEVSINDTEQSKVLSHIKVILGSYYFNLF
jgi:hypothetical protein